MVVIETVNIYLIGPQHGTRSHVSYNRPFSLGSVGSIYLLAASLYAFE